MTELFEKYLSGTANAEEREALLRQLHADEQLGGWLQADMEYADGGRMPEPIRDRILKNVYAQSKRPFSRRRTVAAAAVQRSLLNTQSMPQQDLVIATSMGEHSRVTLPDGTALTLNAQTTVRFNFRDGKRCASVDGEAYFEVARDEEHPFVVEAGEANVACLGTAFNVRNYDDENNVSVVLSNGKVRVSAHEADVTMEPDSRVVMDRKTLALSKHTVKASDYTAWLNGEVKYNNQTLEDIAAELSRNYNISMVITSDELKHERFNGYLGRSSLRNILDVLCLASNMSYYVDNDTMVYVYPRKKN